MAPNQSPDSFMAQMKPIHTPPVQICSAKITIYYTNSNDGIWVGCGVCNWEKNLGFGPTLREAFEGQSEHDNRRRDVGKEGR